MNKKMFGMKVNWPTVGPLLDGYIPLLRLELSPTHFGVDLVTESSRVREAIDIQCLNCLDMVYIHYMVKVVINAKV